MAKNIQVVTTISQELADKFIREKTVSDLDTLPQLNTHIKKAVREFIRDNIGYDSIPIACISRYNGIPGELKSIGISVQDFIPTKTGSSLWQIEMPEDMVVSIEFGTLLHFSNELAGASSEEEVELLLEEFNDNLILGYMNQEDVISFIPFIDLNRCRFFARIDESWSIKETDVPGVQEVKLAKLSVFS